MKSQAQIRETIARSCYEGTVAYEIAAGRTTALVAQPAWTEVPLAGRRLAYQMADTIIQDLGAAGLVLVDKAGLTALEEKLAMIDGQFAELRARQDAGAAGG